jgi:hypothetical protein
MNIYYFDKLYLVRETLQEKVIFFLLVGFDKIVHDDCR